MTPKYGTHNLGYEEIDRKKELQPSLSRSCDLTFYDYEKLLPAQKEPTLARKAPSVCKGCSLYFHNYEKNTSLLYLIITESLCQYPVAGPMIFLFHNYHSHKTI